MSEAITTTMPQTDAAAPAARRPSRSFIRMVLSNTMIRWGARLGVAWIAVMVFSAVFAPFLANSHPLLMKQDGVISSPLLKHLTINDVLILIAAGLALLTLTMRRIAFSARVLAYACVLLALIPAAWWHESLVHFFTRLSFSEHGEQVRPLVAWGVSGLLTAYTVVMGVLIYKLVRSPSLTLPWKIATLALAAGLVVLFLVKPHQPPRLVEYDRYRVMAKAGSIEWKIHTPIPFSPSDRLRDQPQMQSQPPDATHWMGTTNLGADLAANMIYASRIALSIGFISTGIALIIGIIIGGLMGYYSGWVDLLGMRLVEIFSAIPTLILLLAFVAAFGANLYIIMVIIGLTGWVGDAVFVRAEFLRLRNQDFVQAARALGLPLRSILFRHMLPNGVAPLLVSASFGVAGAIQSESVLSFLGIGLKDEASWGRLLNDALGSSGTFYWWLAFYPGFAIFITVLAYNLIGEALRDAIDPHLQKAAHL